MKKELSKQKNKVITAVMVFVFDNENNILLLNRIDNNNWEPVKGGINPGETWQEAAIRELNEETGFNPKNSPELIVTVDDELDTKQGEKTKIRGYVSYCHIDGVRSIPRLEEENGEKEHRAYRWITKEDLKKEKIYPPAADKQKWILIND